MSKPATVPHDNADNSSIDSPHYLMWFRRDLRIADNTALTALCERANEEGAIVSAVFFLTPHQWRSHDMSLSQVDHIARTLPLLATALQTQLNIELTVYVDNAPAVAVYQKLGFEIEGTGRKYALRNGEYVDAYFMARLKG